MFEKEDRTVAVDRRGALKTIGAGAAGVTGVFPGFGSASGSSGNVEIITHVAGNEVRHTRVVSKKWYDEVKRTRAVQQALKKQFGPNQEVIGVGRTPLDDTIGDLRRQAVQVTLDETQGSDLAIPDRVNGVPVLVRKAEQPQEMCYTGHKDNLKGGHGLQYKENGTTSNGTLTCRAFKNGTKYMMSCRHLFIMADNSNTNCLNESTIDRQWYQGGDPVGRVRHAYQNSDVTLLDMSIDGSRTFTNKIVEETGKIDGRTTQDGNDYLMSNNETVYRRGRTTCLDWGPITNLGSITWCKNGNYVDDVVSAEINFQPGDSGGPVYHSFDNCCPHYLVSIATHHLGSNRTHGASANGMYRDYGITFGGSPYF